MKTLVLTPDLIAAFSAMEAVVAQVPNIVNSTYASGFTPHPVIPDLPPAPTDPVMRAFYTNLLVPFHAALVATFPPAPPAPVATVDLTYYPSASV